MCAAFTLAMLVLGQVARQHLTYARVGSRAPRVLQRRVPGLGEPYMLCIIQFIRVCINPFWIMAFAECLRMFPCGGCEFFYLAVEVGQPWNGRSVLQWIKQLQAFFWKTPCQIVLSSLLKSKQYVVYVWRFKYFYIHKNVSCIYTKPGVMCFVTKEF